jgi:SOS-response transcriptional repressor LexA
LSNISTYFFVGRKCNHLLLKGVIMLKKNKKNSDTTDLAHRIKIFRNNYKGGVTQNAFARILEIDQQRLSCYEMGTKVPHNVISKLVEIGANPFWLLLGEGGIFSEPSKENTIRDISLIIPEENNATEFNSNSLEDFYVLPLYSDEAAAGEPLQMRDTEIEGPAVIHRSWCPNPHMTDYVRISASGTSMEPTIPAGSIVTIDRSQSAAEELIGKIVAIAIKDGGVTIKRLRKTSRDGYVGEPDNPTCENRTIYIEEGDRIIGRVTTVHAWLK